MSNLNLKWNQLYILIKNIINYLKAGSISKLSSSMPGGAAAKSASFLELNIYLFYTDFEKPDSIQ